MGQIGAAQSLFINLIVHLFRSKYHTSEINMAAIAAMKSVMLKPSLCRLASTVNSAVFQKYGCPTSVLKFYRESMCLIV